VDVVIVGPIPDDLAATEFEVETLMPVDMAAVVGKGNSTLAPLALIGQGDLVGLMPLPIARHSLAQPTAPVEARKRLTFNAGVTAPSESHRSPARSRAN
jgi:hypothetical protein